MDDEEKFKSDLGGGAGTEFGSESSWTHLGADSDDGVYFFSSGDKESSILSEFGWNFHQEDQPISAAVADEPERHGNLERSSDLVEGGDFRSSEPEITAPIGSNNPSVSSSSSEDPPEKSTAGSGGKPPPEIP